MKESLIQNRDMISDSLFFFSISASHSETKVRFEAVQLAAHESEITLKYSGNRIDVHLGFLQINRHYNVTFVIQDDLGEDLIFDPLQNLHARIIDYEPTEDGMTNTSLITERLEHKFC